MHIFHDWEFKSHWYPNKYAEIIEFHYQKRTCKKCGKEEIIYIYDNHIEMPNLYN